MKDDKANRELLFELDRNSRASYAELGRVLKMAPETVRYRLNALVEDGVIEKFYCIVSMGMLGYSLYKIFLKTESANEAIIEELLSFLLTQRTVVWAVRFDGYFDIGLTLRGENLKEISDTLDAIQERYGEYLAKKSFCANIESEYLPRSYLVGRKKKLNKAAGYQAGSKIRQIDEIDRSLLEQLGSNCRLSAAELAEGLKMDKKVLAPISREAILLRIQRLEKDSLIQGYTIVINHANLKQLHYKALIHLNHCTTKEREHFLNFCRLLPRVQYIIKSIGEWDYEITLEVESVVQFRDIIAEITSSLPRIVKDCCPLRITKFYRYNLVAGISTKR